MSRIVGKVKFYNRTKGFGFIARDGAKDVFVHAKDLPNGMVELFPNQEVSFIVEEHTRGPRARQVEFLR